MGKKWLKVTFQINGKIGQGYANVVQTAGVVEKGDLAANGRYKRIAH